MLDDDVEYRQPDTEDATTVSALIVETFNAFVAPDWTAEMEGVAQLCLAIDSDGEVVDKAVML